MTMYRSRGARRLTLALALLVPLAAAACGDGETAPDEVVPTEDLGFLVTLPDAPALASTSVSLWARKGREEEVAIRYQPRAGEDEGQDFLRFRLDARSLRQRPDGTPMATGDSVLITITVVDAQHLVASFQPSGLRFDADRPARLKFRFEEADDDRDDDGDEDSDDDRIETDLAIWRQEQAGQPWVRLTSRVDLDDDEIEADLTGFTNYAVAYRSRR